MTDSLDQRDNSTSERIIQVYDTTIAILNVLSGDSHDACDFRKELIEQSLRPNDEFMQNYKKLLSDTWTFEKTDEDLVRFWQEWTNDGNYKVLTSSGGIINTSTHTQLGFNAASQFIDQLHKHISNIQIESIEPNRLASVQEFRKAWVNSDTLVKLSLAGNLSLDSNQIQALKKGKANFVLSIYNDI